jgi:hypothetical protein
MSSLPRPLSALLKDILDNLQELIRSEAKLAKAELREELEKSKDVLAWAAIAGVTGFFGLASLLVCAFVALRYAVPDWAAAAIIALLMGVSCGLSLVIGRRRRASSALRPSSSTTQ